jgi:polysaccharide export outer membrane protein
MVYTIISKRCSVKSTKSANTGVVMTSFRQIIIAFIITGLMYMPLLGIDGYCETTDTGRQPDRQASTGLNSDYTIGPGDILDISVWKEAALTKLVTVMPDGKISFPLIGQIPAKDLTIGELKASIEQKIIRYVPHPNLSVAIHQVNSLYIYVVGKVNESGRFELNANVNVLQALAMAGGLNPFAKKSKIKIFRENPSGTLIYDFNYDEVTQGKNLSQNIRLKRGDVIVVP